MARAPVPLPAAGCGGSDDAASHSRHPPTISNLLRSSTSKTLLRHPLARDRPDRLTPPPTEHAHPLRTGCGCPTTFVIERVLQNGCSSLAAAPGNPQRGDCTSIVLASRRTPALCRPTDLNSSCPSLVAVAVLRPAPWSAVLAASAETGASPLDPTYSSSWIAS